MQDFNNRIEALKAIVSKELSQNKDVAKEILNPFTRAAALVRILIWEDILSAEKYNPKGDWKILTDTFRKDEALLARLRSEKDPTKFDPRKVDEELSLVHRKKIFFHQTDVSKEEYRVFNSCYAFLNRAVHAGSNKHSVKGEDFYHHVFLPTFRFIEKHYGVSGINDDYGINNQYQKILKTAKNRKTIRRGVFAVALVGLASIIYAGYLTQASEIRNYKLEMIKLQDSLNLKETLLAQEIEKREKQLKKTSQAEKTTTNNVKENKGTINNGNMHTGKGDIIGTQIKNDFDTVSVVNFK